MAITKAPEPGKKTEVKSTVSEKKVQDFINKGGGTSRRAQSASENEVTKSIKLILTETEMADIKELRDKRRSPRRKIPISVHDWVIEAIHEKLERERRKYAALTSAKS